VFVTSDKKLALIDLGMVGRLSSPTQDRLLELLLAAAEGRGDETADVLIDLGQRRENFDEAALRRDVINLVNQFQQTSLADLQIGRMLLEVNQRAGCTGCGRRPNSHCSARRC
jgi:predicted unusual protein kinase regulating ubiquinone biosynthesis (AarF/ABC1/UbiB family)